MILADVLFIAAVRATVRGMKNADLELAVGGAVVGLVALSLMNSTTRKRPTPGGTGGAKNWPGETARAGMLERAPGVQVPRPRTSSRRRR